MWSVQGHSKLWVNVGRFSDKGTHLHASSLCISACGSTYLLLHSHPGVSETSVWHALPVCPLSDSSLRKQPGGKQSVSAGVQVRDGPREHPSFMSEPWRGNKNNCRLMEQRRSSARPNDLCGSVTLAPKHNTGLHKTITGLPRSSCSRGLYKIVVVNEASERFEKSLHAEPGLWVSRRHHC